MLSLDISRESFQRSKNFTGLRQQQGRVPLESELNEASDIAAEELRRTIQDVICNSGTPDDGFRVDFGVASPAAYEFDLDAGTYYIGGRRYDCYAGTTFLSQPDWMQHAHDAAPLPTIPVVERHDFVYLEGIEHVVSACEDSELFERALGGADGAGRRRRFTRVHVVEDTADNCVDAMADLFGPDAIDPETMALNSGAGITVDFDPNYVEENLCAPEVQGGFQGAENETIRVQLTAPDRYIYGRDNASHLYRVTLAADNAETVATFLTLPRDTHSQPLALQTAEVLRWTATLPNGEHLAEPMGTLANILTDYNPEADTLRLDLDLATLDADWDGAAETYYFLRIWTGDGATSDVDYPITDSNAKVLPGTGLSAAFQQAPNGNYGMAGDFWVIAARPNAPDVVTPWQLMQAAGEVPPPAPPAGPMRHVAPLAVLHWVPNPAATTTVTVHDCRERFRKLCKVPTCCEVTVGDGETSHGDVNTIADALARLPADGGKICLMRGTWTETVVMSGRQNITFCGCGDETTWHGVDGSPTLTMSDCHGITFNHFRMTAAKDDIILAGNRTGPTDAAAVCTDLQFTRMMFEGRDKTALWLNDCNDTRIMDCAFDMGALTVARTVDNTMGVDPAIFVMGDRVHLEHNRIGVDRVNPPPVELRPMGGVQIGGLSEDVILRDNVIAGGKGNGVTLGHIEWVSVPGDPGVWTLNGGWYINAAGCIVPYFELTPPDGSDPNLLPESGGEVRNLRIEGNTIRDMGLNGIAVCHFFDLTQGSDMIVVSDARIIGNDIHDCLTSDLETPPAEVSYFRSYGGIVLGDCDLLEVKGNRIQDNGVNSTAPICGIFVLLGSAIRIDDNHIFANGSYGPGAIGRYGGVNIGWCQTHATPEPDRNQRAAPARRVALSMTDNFIDSPNGQAVKVVVIGPVMMTGNQLIGTARSVDELLQVIGILIAVLPPLTSFATILTALVVSNRVDRNTFATADMLLAELVIAAMGGSAVSVFNAAWLEEMQLFSGLKNFPDFIRNTGGETMFDNNQVTLLPSPNGATNAVSSVLVASMDDVSLSNNQIEIDKGVGIALANAFTPAATVRMTSNRLQETPLSCLFSGLSHSVFLNTQALNQGTHCFAATALLGLGPRFVERQHNLSLMDALIGEKGYCARLEGFFDGIVGGGGGGFSLPDTGGGDPFEPGDGNDTFAPDGGNDSFDTSGGNDTTDTGGGNDTTDTGGGNDTFDPGGGTDTHGGDEKFVMPDLICKTKENFTDEMGTGLYNYQLVQVYVPGATGFVIVGQEPPAGTSLQDGDTVGIFVATDDPNLQSLPGGTERYQICKRREQGGGGIKEIPGRKPKTNFALGGYAMAHGPLKTTRG